MNMDMGVFLPTARNGFIISTTSPQFSPSWEHNREITLKCEELGFGFALSMVKHLGFHGPSRFWDEALDSFTLMAALAPVTERIQLIPSIPILALHPAVAARKAATLNEIAGGRFAVNIVTGWNKLEYETMSLWPGAEHYSRRYDFATEYVTIMQELWRTGRSSFKGEFFELDGAECLPQPANEIPIVCAGLSPRGLRFTAEKGNQQFVCGDLDGLTAIATRLREEASKTGRDVGALALFTVVAAATDEEAQERYRTIVDGVDTEAIANMAEGAQLDTGGGTTSNALTPERSMFLGQTPLVGSYESVARQILDIDERGLAEGIMFSFPDWLADLEAFGEHIQPRLGQSSAATAG